MRFFERFAYFCEESVLKGKKGMIIIIQLIQEKFHQKAQRFLKVWNPVLHNGNHEHTRTLM